MSIDFPNNDEEIILSFLNGIPVCECGAAMEVNDVDDTYECPFCGAIYSQIDYDRNNKYLELIKPYVVTYDDLFGEPNND